MAFDSGDNRIVRPDMGALPGFVGEKGFQGAHVLGEVKLGGQLTNLFNDLNAGLAAGDPRRIDINGKWNGVLLPGGAEPDGSGRTLTEKASAIMGTIAHRGGRRLRGCPVWTSRAAWS